MADPYSHVWHRIDTDLTEADKLRHFGLPPGCRVIGSRLFVDGVTRTVYEDPDERQWVIDGDGERAYGYWLPPADEPVIADPA